MSNKLTSNNLDNQKTCNMNDKTPKEIFLNNPSNPNFKGGDFKYLSEEHFNSLIEKWKDEEKIWRKEVSGLFEVNKEMKSKLEEKDKEIERLNRLLTPICECNNPIIGESTHNGTFCRICFKKIDKDLK